MKKTIAKEVCICDKCKKETDYQYTCLNCGKELCCDCQENNGKTYSHAVYCEGTRDGFYCLACDAKLQVQGTDRLHQLYLNIEALKREHEAWDKDFEARRKSAEKELKAFTP
jgi:hypothetical protein